MFQNAFSGQVIFESWTLSFYNVFFTFLPPFAIGVFDQFISARLLDRYPQLYRLGQKGEFVCSRRDLTYVVQCANILGMDCKWVLSFPYWLYRINLLFHRRRCAIGWTTFRTLGMGNDSVHCNAVNSPWQSCPHH